VSFWNTNDWPFGRNTAPGRVETPSVKKVSWVRAPPGVFTRCSCGTAPNDVVMMISRSVGCHARRIAWRNWP
jgi:hypothetical protein